MKSLVRFVHAAMLITLALTLVWCSKPEAQQAEAAQVEIPEMTPAQEAPAESNRGVASTAFGKDTVSIDYGRPKLQGRDVLAMASEGMVWRMGMNEATEITTSTNLHFGETAVPKGSYSLWMKKAAGNQWQLIFNKKTGIWGHEHPAADDVASVPMSVAANPDTVETFTIEVAKADETSGAIKTMWGTAIVSAAFKLPAASKK